MSKPRESLTPFDVLGIALAAGIGLLVQAYIHGVLDLDALAARQDRGGAVLALECLVTGDGGVDRSGRHSCSDATSLGVAALTE